MLETISGLRCAKGNNAALIVIGNKIGAPEGKDQFSLTRQKRANRVHRTKASALLVSRRTEGASDRTGRRSVA